MPPDESCARGYSFRASFTFSVSCFLTEFFKIKFLAILEDSILRFSWAIKLLALHMTAFHREETNTILSVGEIVRRIVWVSFAFLDRVLHFSEFHSHWKRARRSNAGALQEPASTCDQVAQSNDWEAKFHRSLTKKNRTFLPCKNTFCILDHYLLILSGDISTIFHAQ